MLEDRHNIDIKLDKKKGGVVLDCEVSEEGKILPGYLCDFFVVKNLWCALSSGDVVTAIKSDQNH